MRLIKYKGCIYCHNARASLKFIFENTQVRMCHVCWKRLSQTNVRIFVEKHITLGPSGINTILEDPKNEEWLKKV